MRKILTAVVTGAMAIGAIFAPITPAADAATPTTHWYKDWGQGGIDWSNEKDVKELEDAIRWELYVGYADGEQIHSKIPGAYYGATLRLGNNITRGEFAVALGRCLDIGTDADFPMGRVNPLVNQAVITTEEAAKDFSIPITRAEMAKWMGRAATAFKADTKDTVSFGDTNDRDILAAAGAGVIRGYPDGNFHPQDNAMRAHAALMLVRFSRSLNSDLPEEKEIGSIAEQLLKSYSNMSDKRHQTGIYDNSMVSIASERFVTACQEGIEASGRADDMVPNTMQLDDFMVIEKHNKTLIYWYSAMIYPNDKRLSDKPYPAGEYEMIYAKKADGKWVITGGIATFQKP